MICYENISIYIFFYIYKPFSFYKQKNETTKRFFAIIDILNKQEKDWNRGDIDEFMKGYLKSEKLIFKGINGGQSTDGKQL